MLHEWVNTADIADVAKAMFPLPEDFVDERSTRLHKLLDAMITGTDVRVWLKSEGRELLTRIIEIRPSGAVVCAGDRPGLVLGFEPGQVLLPEDASRL